jgi:hypothetical protein
MCKFFSCKREFEKSLFAMCTDDVQELAVLHSHKPYRSTLLDAMLTSHEHVMAVGENLEQ